MGKKAEILTGLRFGKLTVLERANESKDHAMWLCQCDCGKKKVVRSNNLKQGLSTSCGECERPKEPAVATREIGSVSLSRLKGNADPYQNLANAIVAVAADDYRAALADGDEESKRSLERFFYSEWYTILTNVSANLLIGLLHKEYKENPQRVYI